jgi:hypothetical protein
MRPRLAIALLLAPLCSVGGQVVVVEVRDSITTQPVIGAVVKLLHDSASVGQSLTNTAGRAGIRAPGAGEYRVRVQRIGYAPYLTAPVRVGPEETVESTIRMAAAPVSLGSIQIQSKSECGGKLDDRQLAGAIWSQVQTALTANVVTNAERAVPVRIRAFRRDVDIDGNVKAEVVTSDTIVRGQPYLSPDVASLMSRGFAFLVKDEMTFSAPDANVFVSDEFVSAHCFSAVAGLDSLVGLSFTPVPRRRQSDIRGTLWVNRYSNELKYIEYFYTNLPVALRDLGLGGRVDFARLPGGEWIVSYWQIRMPKMAEPPQEYRLRVRSVPHLASYVDIGGRATFAADGTVARALITGAVFDSASGHPVANAVIRIVGVEDSVLTDSTGRFRLQTDRGGPQTLMAAAPKLGFVDDGSQRDLLISLGDTLRVDFAVPPAGRLAAEFCGAGSSQSGVVGLAMVDGAYTPGLDVRATWSRTPGVPEEERSQSGPRGLFIFCDLPSDLSVKIELSGKAVERDVKLEPGRYQWIELRSGRPL